MIRLCIRHVSGMPKMPVEESLALTTCNYLIALKRAQVKIFAALAKGSTASFPGWNRNSTHSFRSAFRDTFAKRG
jgi:hypothetical protein